MISQEQSSHSPLLPDHAVQPGLRQVQDNSVFQSRQQPSNGLEYIFLLSNITLKDDSVEVLERWLDEILTRGKEYHDIIKVGPTLTTVEFIFYLCRILRDVQETPVRRGTWAGQSQGSLTSCSSDRALLVLTSDSDNKSFLISRFSTFI